MLWFFIILAGALIVYLLQQWIYRKHALRDITYAVHIETDEVIEDEDVYLYEEITNAKPLPLPFVRVELIMPEGLKVRFARNRDLSGKKDELRDSVQSVFVLRGHQTIRRRWRVYCAKRGDYRIDKARIIANDLFGSDTNSAGLTFEESSKNHLLVLPKILPLAKEFVSSYLRQGDSVTNHALLTDPLRIAGSREYTPMDPWKSINWKSTAVHNTLMVNTEEYTISPRFNIILNMQSRDIEADPHVPSIPSFNEDCISVCASVLDAVSAWNLPVRLIANTPPDDLDCLPLAEDEVGREILFSAVHSGRAGILDMLRLLAMIPMEISVPIEKMLDHIVAHPELYASDRNILLVTPYLSERMVIFHEELKKQGVQVLFYVTGYSHNAILIPDDLQVFYT